MDAENQADWQAPPPPEQIEQQEGPRMSEIATIGNIFFEPGATFEDLKRKPRFIIGSIIIALLITAFSFGLYYKVGDTGMRRFISDQIDKSPQTQGMNAEQKSNAIDLQMTIGTVVRFVMPVFVFLSIIIGGLFYWAASKAFGGTGGFLHAVSVWVYSSLPPTIIGMIANFIVMAFKSADDIDIAASQRGLINANLSFLIDGKASPVLATLVSVFDLFAIWGWVLAAIGLRITNKISSASAWAIVIIIALVGVAFRVLFAVMSGNPS